MTEEILHSGVCRVSTTKPFLRITRLVSRLTVLCLTVVLPGPATASAQVTLLSEGFEDAFPGAWSVGDANDEGDAASWSDVDLRSFGSPSLLSGAWAGYCAGAGFAGVPFAPLYQSDMVAYMSRPLDLSGRSGAALTFWYNVPSIETDVDSCAVFMGGSLVWSWSSPTAGWQKAVIDLTPYVGGVQTLSFVFLSDYSIEYEGWYLDDILVTVDQPDPRPALRATRVGNRVVISWTTNSAGYFLYAKGIAGSGNWGAVTTTPVIVGGEKFVTNTVTGNGTFFRLQK